MISTSTGGNMKITAADLAVAHKCMEYLSKQHLDIPGLRWEDIFKARVNIQVYLESIKVEVNHE
jgi:hypothetical protein